MPKNNKHRSKTLNGISESYIKQILKWPEKICHKSQCKGTMIETFIRYERHGAVFKEWECVTCGKVVKPHRPPESYRSNNNFKYKKDSR